MCGIVGATARRDVSGILLEGLKRLEYRGYDSAGLAIIDAENRLVCTKRVGKVDALAQAVKATPTRGSTGISHTRWATHGKPTEVNAHPHLSRQQVALVHNGIIENHESLREQLTRAGYEFVSQTDTEVIVHLVHSYLEQGESLLSAVKQSVARLEGAFGLAVISPNESDTIICARSGSPLVIGLGYDENFIASDPLALRQVTDRFIFLEEGDVAKVTCNEIAIYDAQGAEAERAITQIQDNVEAADRGRFRHYMLKEIHEQPRAIRSTIHGRLGRAKAMEEAFGPKAAEIFDRVEVVQIVACGTSYHAGMVARYWIEGIAGVTCRVEVASEFRYRKFAVQPNTLLVTISQSGETADTLAALRLAKNSGYSATLTICNVAQSSLVRESDMSLMTEAGPEIGVASTKAFTTQLVALMFLTIVLGRRRAIDSAMEAELVRNLRQLPDIIESVLTLDTEIKAMADAFSERHHALFLGRGVQWPIAMEGALKLKEISYIHAESYPAGELKHGPLALVDADVPIVVVAPNDELLEKLKSNLQEVQARGGVLYVFADRNAGFQESTTVKLIQLPHVPDSIAPIVYTVPLQLLAYHVAVLKGTDVDQPRNLAKSVTVE